MAEILICENDLEVLHLLEQAVARLGHEPVRCTGAGDEGEGDLLLVDADDPRALECAALLRAERPDLPVVKLSIYPANPRLTGLDPAAHVVKPFTRAELERALTGTLERWPTASAPTAPSVS